MIPESALQDTKLAAALLDITPKIVRRLRADVPLEDEEAEQRPGWREIRELRATFGQLGLLAVLVDYGPCTMQKIAEHMGVAPSTATAMVKRLYAQGYLERGHDKVDWRTVWVRVTETGRMAVEVYRQACLASLQCRVQRLNTEERASILAALPALYRLVGIER
ncbi:MAG: MarR family winged helix-turn-helix transcriptional regulator [Ktedonobacteraceae bacterium]